MFNINQVEIGDYISEFVGDASPKPHRNDKLWMKHYIIKAIEQSGNNRPLTIYAEAVDTIPLSATRWAYADLIQFFKLELS